jgi:hypothetical protein
MAWSGPRGEGEILTSRQAGGTARDLMRSSSASSVTARPSAVS